MLDLKHIKKYYLFTKNGFKGVYAYCHFGYSMTMKKRDRATKISITDTEAEDFGVQPERRKYFVQFGVSKQNYGAPFESLWLQKESSKTDGIEGGYTLQKAVLEKKNASKSREKDRVFSS